METNLQYVHAIATDVRYWAEGRNDCPTTDLNGWCAIASAQLFRELERQGIKAEIHAWVHRDSEEAHVYLVIDDHVVDVTATQFRQFRDTPVLIMHHREAQQFEYYQTVSVFHSVTELRAWQKKHRWPVDQVAFNS